MNKTKENWIIWVESNIFSIHEYQNTWPGWYWSLHDQLSLKNIEYTTSLGDKLKIDDSSLLWVNGNVVDVI